MHKRNTGFTLVELLIVIVVIAILAAITVVAYNGISKRAQASVAQEQLSQINHAISSYFVDNNAYPTQLSALNIQNTSNVSYQYSVNNTATPATWCVTATSGTTSYYQNNTDHTIPTPGGCPGHGQNGVAAITNLATVPRGTNYLPVAANTGTGLRNDRYGNDGTYSILTGATDGPVGIDTIDRFTVTTATNPGHGFTVDGNTEVSSPVDDASYANLPVSGGQTYTISCYIRYSGPARHFAIIARPAIDNSNWVSGSLGTVSVLSSTNNWVRISDTYTMPAGTNYLAFMVRSTDSNADSIGDTYDATGLMVTRGSTLYNYADGNSPSWIWSGTPNASTSTGPVL